MRGFSEGLSVARTSRVPPARFLSFDLIRGSDDMMVVDGWYPRSVIEDLPRQLLKGDTWKWRIGDGSPEDWVIVLVPLTR